MTRHSYGNKKVEPGQMYQMYRDGDIFVIIEPHHTYRDGWKAFSIIRSRYDWDSTMQFLTQYRRLV